jgi:hypothetical protein
MRVEYVAHIGRILALAGETSEQAAKDADAIMGLETALANASMSPVQMRDPNAVYHLMPTDSLVSLAPRFLWQDYFHGPWPPSRRGQRHAAGVLPRAERPHRAHAPRHVEGVPALGGSG